jgi:hypothetical protein
MSEGTTTDNRGELIGRLKSKLKEAMINLKAREDALKTIEVERDQARADSEKAKSKYDDSKLKAEMESLKVQLRDTKHRTVVDRHLAEAGIRPEARDAFYKLAEYKAEGDEPDEARVKAFVEEAKGKLGYLFGEPEPADKGGGPGPGRGQGASAGGGNGKFRVTRAQLADPHWCRENHDRRKEAMKAGTMEIVD